METITDNSQIEDESIPPSLAPLDDDVDTDAERLATDLRNTIDAKYEDGTYKATIVGIYDTHPLEDDMTETEQCTNSPTTNDDEHIYLAYTIHNCMAAVEVFEKPSDWDSEKYKFVRVINELGYNFATLEQVEGEDVLIQQTTDERNWEVIDPKSEIMLPYQKQVKSQNNPSMRKTIVTQLHSTKQVLMVGIIGLVAGLVTFAAGGLAIYIITEGASTIAETAIPNNSEVSTEAVQIFRDLIEYSAIVAVVVTFLNIIRVSVITVGK